MRTATEFVEAVENMLGWVPAEPRWKSISVEAGKVKKKMATDPALYTLDNLGLALALLQRERKTVSSPVAVAWHVERALKLAEVVEVADDVDEEIASIVEHLSEAGDPDGWIPRLVRAQGRGRQRALGDYNRRNDVR